MFENLDGVRFLVDRVDGSAYDACEEGEWPTRAGVLHVDEDGDEVVVLDAGSRDGTRDVFRALDALLANRRSRAKALFDEYDFDDDGFLNRDEVSRFASRAMPESTAADIRYFTAALDVDGDGTVSFGELLDTVEECRDAERDSSATATDATSDAREHAPAMASLREYATRNDVDARAVFEACDLDGSGALEAPELSEMIARLAPGASRAERRRMLVGTHRAAADDDGKITYAAFLRAARLARLKIVDAKGTEVVLGIEETMRSAEAAEATEDGSSTVASAAEANRARLARYDSRIDVEGSDWTLEAITIGDREFLLDPETRQLFVRASEATARLGPKPRRRRKPSAHRRMRREWAKENAGPASEPTSETESDSDYDFDDSAPSSPEKSDDAETANASPEGWPVLFGRLASNGRVARHRPMLDFFDALKHFCQSRLVPVAKLFQTYDDRQQGRDEEKHASPSLSEAQFSRMVRETLLPAVSSAELAYLHAMLDADGDERVSEAELERAVLECARCGADVAPRASAPSAADVLVRVGARVAREHGSSVAEYFAARTPRKSWSGVDGLDAKQLAAVVEEEFPGIERADVRCALASLRSADLDGDGLVSLPELRRAIRLAVTGRVVPGEGFGRPDPDGKILFTADQDRNAVGHVERARKENTPGWRHPTRERPNRRALAEKLDESAKNAEKMNEAPNVSRKTYAPNASGDEGTGSASKDASRDAASNSTRTSSKPASTKKQKRRSSNPSSNPSSKPSDVSHPPMSKRETLAMRKALRAERVRAEKRAAKGEIDSEDVREAILEVEELYRARAYAKDLARRRAAAERDAFERSLEDETREYREWQLAEFDVAREEAQEAYRLELAEERRRERFWAAEEARRRPHRHPHARGARGDEEGWYFDDGVGHDGESYDVASTRGAFISEELYSKWKSEELLAMVDTYGRKETFEALANLRRDDGGGVAEETVAELAAATRDAFARSSIDDEATMLEMIRQVKNQTAAAREKEEEARRRAREAEEAARAEAEALEAEIVAEAKMVAAERAAAAEKALAETIRSEYDADLALPRMRQKDYATPSRGDESKRVVHSLSPVDGSPEETRGDEREGAASLYSPIFDGYPPSPPTIVRSPRTFVADGVAHVAEEDRSFERRVC